MISVRQVANVLSPSFFLIVMGIFSKFAAALISIPSSVLGGMTTFLFCSVAVSGISIIAKGVPFNRRNRFILTAGLALGYGATLVPNYFSNVFSYSGDNKSLQGFLDAIVLVMETGLAVTAVVCMILNGILPLEGEDLEASGSVVHAVHQGKDDGYERQPTRSREGSDEIQPAEKRSRLND
jgi:NCS2 family nucleobase:cation symporter-2